jgi:hypothetical protein
MRWAIGAGLAGWLGLELVLARENPIAYFNGLAGGQAHAYRHFTDSNCDWLQAKTLGEQELRARYGPELQFLRPGDGPRLGLVAAYVVDLAPPDPRDPRRSRHWLDAFEPLDHHDAAWYVFDASAASFDAAARHAGDPRVHADFALALLGARDVAAARREIDLVDATSSTQLSSLLQLVEQHELDRAETQALVAAWREAARPDLAVAVGARLPVSELGSARLPYLLALVQLGDLPALERTLAEPANESGTSIELLLLAQARHDQGQLLGTLELLAAHEADLRRELPGQIELVRRSLRREWELTPPWVRAVWQQRAAASKASH